MDVITDADLLRATSTRFHCRPNALKRRAETGAVRRYQTGSGPADARQMKEGAALAVQLADRLQRFDIVSRPQAV